MYFKTFSSNGEGELHEKSTFEFAVQIRPKRNAAWADLYGRPLRSWGRSVKNPLLRQKRWRAGFDYQP
jgi:hypothetical protein